MHRRCDGGGSGAGCASWRSDPLVYRMDQTRQVALGEWFFAADTQGTLGDVEAPAAFVDDQDGDGVADLLRPGPAERRGGGSVTLEIQGTGAFAGKLQARS